MSDVGCQIYNSETIEMHNYQELQVWKSARELNLKIYQMTETFPKSELYALTSQIQRSSVSISSNIAEGCGYQSDKQLVRFLDIAMGSLCELESQLYLAHDLQYLEEQNFKLIKDKLIQTRKMLYRFRQSKTKII